MDPCFHPLQRNIEDWHFWYVVRRDILALLLVHGMDPEVIMSLNSQSPAREEASYLASLNEAQKIAHLASLAQEPSWS